MICPKCETMMESMGYGDACCPKCGHCVYTESKADFYDRIYGNHLPEDEEQQDGC
jgi:tRNA(Ile2) C34 agmatinyltransferase TiaS